MFRERTQNRCRWRRRGQATVEAALVLPFLMILLAGVIDLGRVMNTYIALTNAVREGARYGATHVSDTAGAQQRVLDELSGTPVGGLTTQNITVTTPNGTSGGSPVVVAVSYNFSTLLGRFIGMSTIPIHAQAQMPIM